jgi:hypothetical protein
MGYTEFSEQLGGITRRFPVPGAVLDVLSDGHMREERVILEHETESPLLRRLPRDIRFVRRHYPGVLVEAGDRL